ncbi:hypothetical protein [Actinocatenispora sera]|uniref:Uncharacterized protein n=1 Tax=Actinocatenispora sera TaxID=390989 RepID=A0A810KUY4_9ACTN|nr:hypothetical protein [Actinocatenispora sera]BCJ25918.1 hypothetical protein Asera_00260 [Actinocatenispora sera]
MQIPRRTLATLVGLALAAGTVGVVGIVTAAPSHSTDPPLRADAPTAAPAAPVARTAASEATVTLVTGDRLRVSTRPDGTTSVTPLVAPSAGAYTSFVYRGDRYVVPAAAAPYLGSALDVRLFDVSYLVRAKLDDAHARTVPVAVAGSDDTALPATTTDGGTTAVTKKSAGKLGRMLATRWRRGHPGTLPGGGRLTLAHRTGAPALPAAPVLAGTPKARQTLSPNSAGLPFETVTIDAIDRSGNEGTVVGYLQNVDDARLGVLAVAYPGQPAPLALSVPRGTYSFEFSVMDGPADDLSVQSTLVVKPEVPIDGDTSITLDARQGVPYDASVADQPADDIQVDMMTYARSSATGGGVNIQAYGYDGALLLVALHLARQPGAMPAQLFATPTPPVRHGTMNFAAISEVVGSIYGSNPDPRYFLMFPHQGSIPSSLTYRVPAADLTAVHTSMHASPCATCTDDPELLQLVFLPWSQDELGLGALVPLADRVDYRYSSEPSLTVWQSAFNASDGTRRWGPRETLKPGRLDEEFNRGPAVPSPAAPYLQTPSTGLGGAGGTVRASTLTGCGACRQDDDAVLWLQPLGDSDPSHYGAGNPVDENSSVRFWRNGKLALTSDTRVTRRLSPNGVVLPMLATAADYRLDWASIGKHDTEHRVTTSWRFRSGPSDAAAPLPPEETCSPDQSRSCSFLPLLYVTYDLPLDLHDRTTAGAPYTFGFTVAGQQHSTQRATAATVSVSYDDGTTWSDPVGATATGHGRFTATVDQPALADTTGFASLRISAQDADGNAVTQTVIHAYGMS